MFCIFVPKGISVPHAGVRFSVLTPILKLLKFSGIYFLFFLWLCLTVSVSPAQKAASQKTSSPAPQDTLKQHYDAAHTFYLGGDVEHAAGEYNAFLAESLHRLAVAYSNARDFV